MTPPHISIPNATLVERSQLEFEQLLAMLRFDQRGKLAELPGDLLESIRSESP